MFDLNQSDQVAVSVAVSVAVLCVLVCIRDIWL